MRLVCIVVALIAAGLITVACTDTDSATRDPGDAEESALTAEEDKKASTTREPSTGNSESSAGNEQASGQSHDGRLVGRWEQVPWQTEIDIYVGLYPVILPIDDTRLIVVRTYSDDEVSAYVYDSATGEIKGAAPSGHEWLRSVYAVVWTGNRVLIVGGADTATRRVGSGYLLLSYDPAHDVWEKSEADPMPRLPELTGDVTWLGSAVWTGSEVLFAAAGVALDPVDGSWRVFTAAPLADRRDETTVWTGQQVVIWGGCGLEAPYCEDHGSVLFTDGAIYDPSTDAWRAMSSSPLPPGAYPTAAWTGSEIIYFAGIVEEDASSAAGYDPTLDQWRLLPAPPVSPRQDFELAWSQDAELLFGWGGSHASIQLGDGAVYDPSTAMWLRLPEAPHNSARDRHAVAAVGHTFYVDGGWPSTGPLALTVS
ncbi:MAG: hypothetical protein OXG41_00670 [Acidimicrobiaceae bacterium]|nr:hypothetical protein [Acidimicrobiaceae bacterium]